MTLEVIKMRRNVIRTTRRCVVRSLVSDERVLMTSLMNKKSYQYRTKHILTKTLYNYGKQCHKLMYLYKHYKRHEGDEEGGEEGITREEYTPQEISIMENGKKVGKLAQELFPGGVDCSPETFYNFSSSIPKTRKLISINMPVLYEAYFESSEVLVGVDILVKNKNGNGWDLYEVKSSTSVKNEHINDISLQYYILKQSGIVVNSANIIHIDSNYIWEGGPIDIHKLFRIVDVTEVVLEKQESLPLEVFVFKSIVNEREIPSVGIGPHCSSPYSCKFKKHCFQKYDKHPGFSVLDLKNGGKKIWTLVNKGVTKLVDVPLYYKLTEYQQIQLACNSSDEKYIYNVKEIEKFLSELHYPLFFMVI